MGRKNSCDRPWLCNGEIADDPGGTGGKLENERKEAERVRQVLEPAGRGTYGAFCKCQTTSTGGMDVRATEQREEATQ